MKILYVDCSGGVTGEAFFGAMADLAGCHESLVKEIGELTGEIFNLSFKKKLALNIYATTAELNMPDSGRSLPVREFIGRYSGRAGAGDLVAIRLRRLFTLYTASLSRLLNIPADNIEMDEKELTRATVFATGAFIALNRAGADKIVASPLPVGGRATPNGLSAAPLLLELARGSKICGAHGRLATPLGVALLASCTDSFGELPEMLVETTGYGFVEYDHGEPALIKAVCGTSEANAENSRVLVVETSIDDMNPEFYPYLLEKLFTAGALDAFLTPIVMKKGRPANLLTVLCEEDTLENILREVFGETTTLGTRIRVERRRTLQRKFFVVDTPYGSVSVKTGILGENGGMIKAAPEYEDCKRLALKQGIPLKEVYAAAQRAAFDKMSSR